MPKSFKDVRISIPMEHAPVVVAVVVSVAAMFAGMLATGSAQAELIQQHTMHAQ